MIIIILVLSTSRELAESLLFMLFWKLCWNWFWKFSFLVSRCQQVVKAFLAGVIPNDPSPLTNISFNILLECDHNFGRLFTFIYTFLFSSLFISISHSPFAPYFLYSRTSMPIAASFLEAFQIRNLEVRVRCWKYR